MFDKMPSVPMPDGNRGRDIGAGTSFRVASRFNWRSSSERTSRCPRLGIRVRRGHGLGETSALDAQGARVGLGYDPTECRVARMTAWLCAGGQLIDDEAE